MTEPDDPGGVLRVSPAGTVHVSTDAMLASAERLRALEAALAEDSRRVIAADTEQLGVLFSGITGDLAAARDLCVRGREMLARAAEAYTRAELMTEGIQRGVAEAIAALLGSAFRTFLLLVLANPRMFAVGAVLGWTAIPESEDGRLATVAQFLTDNPELITSPEFVRFVSLASTSLDDAALGFTGLPVLALLLPEPRDRGVSAGGRGLITVGSLLGMFRETPVEVERRRTDPVAAPPEGVRARLDRIPEGDQVRVETYTADGMPPRHAVYIGPTETFSPFAEGEPWDMTSNTGGVAGMSAGSFRAVELAMKEAGVQPGDEVFVTGFSQGGLLATMVAGSGHWNVVGVETHAAPAGNIALPDGLAGLAIRHTDDLVPALAGPQLDRTLVQVEREAFAGDEPIPDDRPAPAHQRTAYERTATAIDAAESDVVRGQVRAVDDFLAEYSDLPGYRATSTRFHAERVLE